MSIPDDKKKLIELDGLRGLACLLVISHHYFTGAIDFQTPEVISSLIKILRIFFLSGVDLFFVLSGFLVGGIIIDNHKKLNFLKVFFIRRVCRIFPVYFLLIFSFWLGLFFFSTSEILNQWLIDKPHPFWTYLTFLQSYSMGIGDFSGASWVAVSWTVSVEEQFYLLVPFIFILAGVKRAFVIIFLGLLIAPFLRNYFTSEFGFYGGYMFFPGRMDSIFWGVLLAFITRSTKWTALFNKHSLFLLSCIVFILITLSVHILGLINGFRINAGQGLYFSLLAILYFLIIWAVLENKIPLFNRLLRGKILTITGILSYSMYMFHQLINGLMFGFIFNSKPSLNGDFLHFLVPCISLLIVYVFSFISFKFMEQPIRKFGHKFTY